jgi:hypothetical protein
VTVHSVVLTGPTVLQSDPCVVYTDPQPVPRVMYVVPGLYGAYTSAWSGTALEPHSPADGWPCADRHTVNELGLIEPVQGYGVSVAMTIGVPETSTTRGSDSV